MMELKRLKKLEADRLRVKIPERHQSTGVPHLGTRLWGRPFRHLTSGLLTIPGIR